MGENQPFDGYTPQYATGSQKSWRLFHSYNSKPVNFTGKGWCGVSLWTTISKATLNLQAVIFQTLN